MQMPLAIPSFVKFSTSKSPTQFYEDPEKICICFHPVCAHDHGRERASPAAGRSGCNQTKRRSSRRDPYEPAGQSTTVTHWYKQNVYDPADNKIGEIMDVLVDRDGKITALIVGVGGFLGMGEKDVAVPFNSVRTTTKDNNKWYLVMNSTKDALKSAWGLKYDRNAMT